jgi:YihY family inner membrane protein
VKSLEVLSTKADGWQRRHRVPSVIYAVTKKFGDDNLNQYVVGLGWYGFVAIYPLLLVVITIFGFLGQAALGHGIVSTLHQFPVVGSQFNPAHSNRLHGSVVGLVIGLVGLVYGAQGVTQTAQQALTQAWNVPRIDAPGFVPRLVRSLLGLVFIGASFLVSSVLATLAEASSTGLGLQILVLVALVVVNAFLFLATFRALTPRTVATRPLIPGAIVGSVGFSLLITVGSGLIQHQVRNSSATYGQFGIVIGLVGFLFLVAKITLYGVELNPVLHRRLWPRGIRNDNPTPADDEVLADVVHEQRRRSDQVVAVGFGSQPVTAAVEDARTQEASASASAPAAAAKATNGAS